MIKPTKLASNLISNSRQNIKLPSILSLASAAAASAPVASSSSYSRSISTTKSKSNLPRPNPAPAFQQKPSTISTPTPTPQPLNQQTSIINGELMDHSFIGMSGGQIFHEMMLRHNVKHVFGYPGGAILPVFDAIHNSKHFDFILPRHEQGAGHMAEGYARVSGKPGVVLVTSGPGATNTITPLQDAYSDGTPLIVFTGQVATSAIGSDAFQEADVIGISRSCTKWNVMVKDVSDLPRRINEAFKIATSGRPGPVLVDLPKDMTAGILRTPIPLKYTQPDLIDRVLPSNPLRSRPWSSPADSTPNSKSAPFETRELRQAADMIINAKRPVIYAGQGILSSDEGPKLLRQLADQWNIPVTTTLMGMGAFDEEDPKSLHMLGMHGSAYANLAMQDADVLIALGARFDDRVTGKVNTFAPHALAAAQQGRGGIIHFEIQPKNINKVVQATCSVEGDVVQSLTHLLNILPARTSPPERTEWRATIQGWKEKYPFVYESSGKSEAIKPQEVIEALNDWSKAVPGRKDNLVISTGVGQHQMWAAQHYRWTAPRSIVTSGGLGTMGYGLPAAIGAKVARPDKFVVDIDGDASFSMTAMELATAHEFNIGVKVIVLDNEFQGMVLQWQDLFYESRYSGTRMTNPDFAQLAKAMRCHAIYCDQKEDLKAKIDELMAFDNSRPVLLHVKVTDKEHCFPMVPAGKALHEQILHPILRNKASS
ncbi:acetolactate synthase, large subunit, biosynthetic type [Puccinia triticina 1-1 BBBD Race 1]|uniref:Acetolactate synthase n=2 Tax=Puccinia triticina TaxID=208348 RepID=A0A0C4F7L4_PUCT1|nr:acetolactate synthase, large subunit, biosynthetic type [Puccinia triticina 1-1 BBBD Race 1]